VVAPLAALKAYAAAQKTFDVDPGSAAGAASQGPSFAKLLGDVVGGLEQSSKAAETQMAAHAQGKADLVDVVTSVASAETSLETVMAVRDQVIAAYQEILRMPI
jgi:flagellar hook-basal body complex protein FliE